MTTPHVIGLDLSLASTGVAMSTLDGRALTSTVRPKKINGAGIERLNYIVRKINDWTDGAALVVVEGPSYGSSGAGAHERAGLWWLVARSLHSQGIPYAVAPPTTRALYAYGDGSANKREVIAAISAFCPWWPVGKRAGLADEADALTLCAMGCDHLGAPIFEAPERHRKALAGVQWPEMPSDL
jgi:crossover junction endodeoxyribonuclease RuvC